MDQLVEAFDEATYVLEHIKWAAKCGLEKEWMITFLHEIKNYSVQEACFHADCEWDL